jgi:glycosyltransferase involved in cell wall biosynthesis
MTTLVSILVPAYNAGEWIADTLQSAVAQTWPHREIIVVDDGSRDDTAAIARRFAPQGVTVVSQPNQGAAAARNAALSLSRGDYIQWLDAAQPRRLHSVARRR